MRLFNSLTGQIEKFNPQKDGTITIYSCGPTVYDKQHIGNLAAAIYADTLRRTLKLAFPNHQIKHVMNITDVDDKTIAASHEKIPELEPKEALKKLTTKYEELFLKDLAEIGVDTGTITFVRATENIEAMQQLIKELINGGFAYIGEDGIYFSIEKYRQAGKKYGQLTEITAQSTGQARVRNDEYDKDNIHDFALWKIQKENEPAWDFEINGQNLKGRPGWHIECSAMSVKHLGQPFDIHTGGVDLKFPHHENEIAQSTANNGDLLARFFFHSEHLLVDGQKMSKSLNNFYTLEDIKNKGFDPLAFRLLILQSNYQNQAHFSWENLQAAQNRLNNWRAALDLLWQEDKAIDSAIRSDEYENNMLKVQQNNLGTPSIVTLIDEAFDKVNNLHICKPCIENVSDTIHQLLGIDLLQGKSDISEGQKALIAEREEARKNQDWQKADKLRAKLAAQGIEINDTPHGPIWRRL